MAGRGRGRGRGSVSFDIGSLGLGRGESIPSSALQPPPLYPPLEFRPSPLSNTEVDNYLLVLKQELRGAIKESPYYIKPKAAKKDIERFSDQYKKAKNDSVGWTPDWNFFPKELKPSAPKRKAKRTMGAVARPKIVKRESTKPSSNDKDMKEKLENLEKNVPEKDQSDEEGEGDEDEEVAEYDDEDEDDNDYNFDYYDDGGDAYGQADDDGDEGPVY